jgi:hypothetical protein
MAAVFEHAGWFPGRQADVRVDAPPGHPARALLLELSGLALVRPRSSVVEVHFQPVSMAAGRVVAWATALRTHMSGIAETDDAQGELYMTDAGHVIGCSLVHDAFWLQGRTFAEAMERIWSGERSRPMLLPGQEETVLYGTTFRPGDPEILTPDSPELR